MQRVFREERAFYGGGIPAVSGAFGREGGELAAAMIAQAERTGAKGGGAGAERTKMHGRSLLLRMRMDKSSMAGMEHPIQPGGAG